MVYVFFHGYGSWRGYDDEGYQKIVSAFYTACGVFILSESDEVEYKYTKILPSPTKLLPCNHIDSDFSRAERKGYIFDEAYGFDKNEFFFSVGKPVPEFPNELIIIEPPTKTDTDTELLCSAPNQSDQLKILCQASEKFWANASKEEKDTHTKNEIVINWLIEQGVSKVNAKQGATIIRPVWAAKGNY